MLNRHLTKTPLIHPNFTNPPSGGTAPVVAAAGIPEEGCNYNHKKLYEKSECPFYPNLFLLDIFNCWSWKSYSIQDKKP